MAVIQCHAATGLPYGFPQLVHQVKPDGARARAKGSKTLSGSLKRALDTGWR